VKNALSLTHRPESPAIRLLILRRLNGLVGKLLSRPAKWLDAQLVVDDVHYPFPGQGLPEGEREPCSRL
jgi:hypothetical protein